MFSGLPLSRIRRAELAFGVRADADSGKCWACGEISTFAFEEIINDDLARQWGVNKRIRHAYSSRESRQCEYCRSIYRNRLYSQTLCDYYSKEGAKDLKHLVKEAHFRSLLVAEINACGWLHNILKGLPRLSYSEYGSEDTSIRSEDIQALSYGNDMFDVVLTSDTMEHIPSYAKAFSEIHRILKPGGKHFFTIPILWNISTRRRAEFKQDGGVNYLVEGAYHGPPELANLVWTDFGKDIIEEIDSIGFDTVIERVNILNPNDVGCVFVSTKRL